ncbi:lantibiotic dehydratase [Nonomuraea sp. NPDC049400]|uniref:lantibiotic dehydratase n=1 Tax=Nonomuraea sp. NPDC049400 TaxID=3364352 RepID=UPI003792B6AE
MNRFSPYVLFRRGTLGISALDGLVPVRTWALLEQAEHVSARRAAVGERLADELYQVIPSMPAEDRRELLRMRRDLHNGRRPRARLDHGRLPGHCRDLLAEWEREHEAEAALLAEVEETLAAESEAARKTLAEVARDENMQRGIQMSGEDVYREVMAYAADPLGYGRKPSKRRRVESTITSYAYRVVFKPSPFGAFTEIGAGPWESATGTGADRRRSLVRLSTGLLAWMTHRLHLTEGWQDLLKVRLNNSLRTDGERAVFIRRPLEGEEDVFSFAQDQVVNAKETDLVRLLVETLGAGEVTQRALCERLVEAGLTPEQATTTIDQLVRLGLCHRGIGLPDQTIGFAGEVAALLRQAGSALAETFESLQRIEDSFGRATAEERAGLLAELRDLVRNYAATLGCRAPGEEALRAVVYEDVGTGSAPAVWQPDLLEANGEHLELFQRILPVLDSATLEKEALYRFFTERYQGQADLIDFYAAFAALPPQQAGELMSGVGSPEARQVLHLRQRFFDLLDDDPAREEVRIDPDRLRAFADEVTAVLPPWRSAAYRVQFSRTAGRRLAVVNGVTTGHGVFFSRYCHLLAEPGGWDLGEELARTIAETNPRQVDLNAVLALNFNLHPRLTDLELVYPGAIARDDGRPSLTLADVAVRADATTRRLRLVSKIDGETLDLVPLNFLYPAAAPPLYRFLCAFAPTRTYRGGLWEQRDRFGPPTGRPRVVLGDLVLDRRSWCVPLAEVPALDGLERGEPAALERFDRWRREAGIPRYGFFRILRPVKPPVEPGDFLEETRRWALEARSARLHKPHFLDARQPLLLHVLAKQATAAPGGTLVIHECLPALAEYGQDGPHSAEEFFIEYTLGGAGHVIG